MLAFDGDTLASLQSKESRLHTLRTSWSADDWSALSGGLGAVTTKGTVEIKMDCFKHPSEKVMPRTFAWRVAELNNRASSLINLLH